MAKRKRLAPAQPRDLEAAPLETKSMPGLSAHPAPPIASVAGDAATSAALEELSETLRRARAEGRLITPLPLEQIDASYLVRDRINADADEMQALVDSIRKRGQQTPIEVVDLGGDRYGLISGWRRLAALRSLQSEDAGIASVKALITQPGAASDAYLAMVEENEIRVGLSYFERARIVIKAVEAGVYDSDKLALQTLFSSASRAKRSKIKSFIPVVQQLGSNLRFASAMGERLGLDLSKALDAEGAHRSFRLALSAADPQTAEAEFDVLRATLKRSLGSKETPKSAPKPSRPPVHISRPQEGHVLLAGVDDQLRRDLEAWLKARGRL